MDFPYLFRRSISAYLEYFRGVVLLRHLVEELDDVGEVHVPVNDDVPVGLHQTQGNEEIELWTSNLPCSPDRLPNS